MQKGQGGADSDHEGANEKHNTVHHSQSNHKTLNEGYLNTHIDKNDKKVRYFKRRKKRREFPEFTLD